MRLAACYTVFDGLELLGPAIQQIESQCDFIIICYQSISNTGKVMKGMDADILKSFLGHYATKPHVLISYNTDLTVNAKENERRKHTQMIDKARQLGATHFLMGATDHFYDPVEFEFGKRLVDAMGYDSTFTPMYTYYKHPTWQITPIENYYMPFICKLYPHTKIEKVRGFPLLVDPSVQMNTLGKWYQFKEFEVMMHHYSVVRKDIRGKFENAASPWKQHDIDSFVADWNSYDLETNPGIRYFQGRKVKVVPDFFNLNPIFEHV